MLYENGTHPITYGTAVVLAEELGIDCKRLLDEYTSFVGYPCRELLRKMRNDLSLTQNQIAKEIGVSRRSYSQWEQGVAKPCRKRFENIVLALNKRNVNIYQYI
jgi:DNA-binding XRE family transcriptional regulator